MSPFDRNKYSHLLGLMESGNDYTIINSIGALGKYQFMPTTLNSLKSKYNLEDWKDPLHFVSNPYLQEIYLSALIKDQLNFIDNNNFKSFIGRSVTGSIRFKNVTAAINIYGIMAAMHLSGAGNVLSFFSTGYNPDDGKTSLSDYMAFFSLNIKDLNLFPLLLAFIPAIVLYYT